MLGIKEIEATDLRNLLESGQKVRLIDVRSAAEYNQGMIAEGEFIPLHTLPLRMNDLMISADETLVIYCRSGHRSAQACLYLKQNAEMEALNLRGGIISWHQSGYEVVSPAATVK